jgi:hypothetical protein
LTNRQGPHGTYRGSLPPPPSSATAAVDPLLDEDERPETKQHEASAVSGMEFLSSAASVGGRQLAVAEVQMLYCYFSKPYAYVFAKLEKGFRTDFFSFVKSVHDNRYDSLTILVEKKIGFGPRPTVTCSEKLGEVPMS